MKIVPKIGRKLFERVVHMVLGGKPEKHVVHRRIKLSELLSVPKLEGKNGKIRLEVDMDVPLELMFNKSLQVYSKDRLVLGSDLFTHLNPIWNDGTPVKLDDLQVYEEYIERSLNTKKLEHSEGGSCGVVPQYTAHEFEELVKRVNSLENRRSKNNNED